MADDADTVSMHHDQAATTDFVDSQRYSFWDTLERVASLVADNSVASRPKLVEFSGQADPGDRFRVDRSVESSKDLAPGEDPAAAPPEEAHPEPVPEARVELPMRVYGQIRTLLADVDELGNATAPAEVPTSAEARSPDNPAETEFDPEAGSEFLASLERKNRTFDKTGEIDVDLDRVASKLDWSRGDDDVVVKRRRGRKRK